MPLFFGLAKICLDETAPYEQQVPNAYVSTLSLRPNVDALILPACLQLGIRYAIGVVRIERKALLFTVRLVVEEDASTCDAVIRPVMNGAFMLVCCRPNDIRSVSIIVEHIGRQPSKMSESIPLRATLRIQFVRIIVGHILCQCLDVMLEDFSMERRCLWMVEGKARSRA